MTKYEKIIDHVFFTHFEKGIRDFEFQREELAEASATLGLRRQKNLGDIVYTFRYRRPLPDSIRETEPDGLEWIIEGAGISAYRFRLVRANRISPSESRATIKIPDSTPEIIAAHSMSDEQALLAIVRYNRLIDVFLGLAAFSLQNHLRTTVRRVGQIEIDEVYVGVDSDGRQYVVPVQAKGGTDQLSVVQSKQDIACCEEKFPELICRSVSAQFIEENLIALFELELEDDLIVVREERHYRLVPHSEISAADLRRYRHSL